MAKFSFDTGQLTVLQNAHAATAGFLWLVNAGGSSRVLVTRIAFVAQCGTALLAAAPTGISVERMTFTGTPSGATVASCARVSTEAVANLSMRTAITGMTPTAGAVLISFIASAALTAAGATASGGAVWEGSSPLELATGQGLVVRQSTAGVLLDTRVVSLTFQTEEV